MRLFENADPDAGRQHYSAAYYRYFEGYTEYYAPDETGRERIVRVYTENWRRQKLTKGQRWGLRAGYLLLYCFVFILFVFASARDTAQNHCEYVSLLVAVALFFYLRLGLTVLRCLLAPEKMTLGAYRETSEDVVRRARLSAALFFLTAAGALLYCGLERDLSAAALQSVGCWLSCGLLTAAFVFVQRRVPYEEVENPLKGKVEGAQIY